MNINKVHYTKLLNLLLEKNILDFDIKKCSIGERKIFVFLKNNNIFFEREKSFKDLKNKQYLRYDFYLPDYNLLIEFDGEQHYFDIRYEGEVNDVNKRDKMKDNYAKEHNIDLLRIPFWEIDNIEKILKEKLNIE